MLRLTLLNPHLVDEGGIEPLKAFATVYETATFSIRYIHHLVPGAGIEPTCAQLMRLAGNQHPSRSLVEYNGNDPFLPHCKCRV